MALYFAQFGAVYPVKELPAEAWQAITHRENLGDSSLECIFNFFKVIKGKKVTSTHQRPHVAGRASDTYQGPFPEDAAEPPQTVRSGTDTQRLLSIQGRTCDQREHRKKGQRHDQVQSENGCGCPRISLIFFCQFFSRLVF